jgi:Thioredoxin-like
MKQLVVFILLLTTFFSCKTDENSCGQAYLGGEIINPNNDYVLLYNDTAFIDTLYLGEDNRFSYKIENLNPGLHRFYHGGEYQVVIIEPTDSIMIRLNTFDFDESLVFSGNGSKKNNYLINMFLSQEKEERNIYEFSKLNPIAFLKKLDSIKAKKYNTFNTFTEKYPTSELLKKLITVGIDYSHYTNKERYPLSHFGSNNPINLDSLPKGYYDFRKNIDYNDEDLIEYYPYYVLLFNNLNNLASEKYFAESGSSFLIRSNIDYNLNKLELVDDLVHSDIIKNIILKYSTRNFLSNSASFEDSKAMYNSYIDKNTNKANSEYITSLFNTLKRLKPGNLLPDIDVLNYKNKVNTLHNIITKPTILYFWSNANKYYFKRSHTKVTELQKIHPDINFISINVDANNTSVWKRLLKQNNCSLIQEYRFRNPQVAKKLLAIQYINKVIVVDRNNTIISSNANMFDMDFNTLLQDLK